MLPVIEILVYPHKALATDWNTAWSVTEDDRKDPQFEILINCMIHEMYKRNALGLAANQIGEPAAVFVIDVDGDPLVAINPTVHELGESIEMEEACLSLPEVSAKVLRSKYANLIYTTPEGEVRSCLLEGVQAQAAQHEMDHLTGKLYWDRLSSMKRDMLKRKYKKIHKYKE